jgi:hypothetical protein
MQKFFILKAGGKYSYHQALNIYGNQLLVV